MQAIIKAIEYHLPERTVTNHDLASLQDDWDPDRIEQKTGIRVRRQVGDNETASDLAVAAAQRLFASGACQADSIDFLLLCTQAPDYFLPTTACLIQTRLGLPKTCGALDFNLGCSGFIYGLGLAKGLIETHQAKTVLLITAETYTRFMEPGDLANRMIFGDGAAATLLVGKSSSDREPAIGPFVYGTDGAGASNLMVAKGGMRNPLRVDDPNEPSGKPHIHMNGPAIFTFTLSIVPKLVNDLLVRSGKKMEDIDLFIFHQANMYMLNHLRKKLTVPEDKFFVFLGDVGNTVSSTIPIALHEAGNQGRLHHGQLIMLVGFGVGYSWGATLIRWSSEV
ncbi:MAG: ketoacyl-ACP synthase III [Nitrospirae bacterium]|nr:ketoacyl-ACP synthase III [Magnetococcales bacterium]HAT50482.1 3-oxoacyl-ACP synthase [Alphaproteobacteria bacterium]